jgi:hypothetical protein
MSETLTYNEAPADQAELNADELDSLAVAEAAEGESQEMLAGKFKDAKSLEQAYLELQRKLGEQRDEVQSDDEGDEEYEGDEEESEEVEEEGDESEERLTQEQADKLFEMVGGKKAYQAMIQWAGENLSQPEIEMYDQVMGRGDPSAIFFAVQALSGRFNDAVGKDGKLLTGRGASSEGNSFRSQAELVQAMSDARYDRDPAYRQDVMRKLENSDLTF